MRTYLTRSTESRFVSCVLGRSVLGFCGLAGAPQHTHRLTLCLRCAKAYCGLASHNPNTLDASHHRRIPHYQYKIVVWPLTFKASMNLLFTTTMSCACFGCTLRDNCERAAHLGIRPVWLFSPPILSLVIRSLVPPASDSSSFGASFCRLQLRGACRLRQAMGESGKGLVDLRHPNTHKQRAGAAAAERDRYNNPCSRSVHVLNYCHKCSSNGLRRDHQSRLAISKPDALSLFRYITASWPSAPNKLNST